MKNTKKTEAKLLDIDLFSIDFFILRVLRVLRDLRGKKGS